jgi:glucosamine--fructose-6-phosphate aminotransferase (isomerizing)
MCGIVAYSGPRNATEVLLQGLSRLEYRGYDSAGVCIAKAGQIVVRKKAGRLANLQKLLADSPVPGSIGISHTRWATHGEPNDANAHPHLDQSGNLALVHNGVIENYSELRARMIEQGHTFLSQTDTEVLAHLVGVHYERLPETSERLVEAVKAALREVTGTYGIAVIHKDRPKEVVGARRGSPLILGVGKGEFLLASDVTALVTYTRDVVYLADYDVVHICDDAYSISSLTQDDIERSVSRVEWDSEAANRGPYPHFMLKEIFEQPQSLENVLRGRLSEDEASAKFGGLNLDPKELRLVDRIQVVACGSAMHAAMVGRHILETLAHLPVDVDFASEFRYRNPCLGTHTLVFAVSQSGETADTLAAMREAQRKGHRTLGIVNAVGSTIARESDGGVYLHAGPEIGVAATKSFTSQVAAFALLGLYFGRMHHLSVPAGKELIKAFQQLPRQVADVLRTNEGIRQVAIKYAKASSMLFFGRLANYPVAMEGALKLKEISYIHAEAYPSAELKHGIIALICPEVPSVFISTNDGVYEKTISNIQEVRARKGPVIAVAHDDDKAILEHVDDVLTVPRTHPVLQPILNTIPLQLFAYHAAVALGKDVDKPRNLAKSVTVE